MPILPAGLRKQTEIAEVVAEAERLLAPDVVRIRFEIKPDWSEEWAIYFRAVLSDEAVAGRLRDTAKRVESCLAERLDFEALGLHVYHRVRSESEQAALRSPAWV